MDHFYRKIPTFRPSSAAAEKYPEIILQGVERFPYALDELGQLNGEIPKPLSLNQINEELEIADRLRERFNHYGSDKSRNHSYHLIYGELLNRLGIEEELNILEIGLGTSNTELISNMGANGKPGASLRAFRDVAVHANIYGADIDRDILFEEKRIKTAWVDQMSTTAFIEMHKEFGDLQYDLVIDDGLHAISANLNTLLYGLQHIKPNGWVVIEDIWSAKVCWQTVYRLISPKDYNKYIVSCPEGCWVFLAQKRQLPF